SLGKFASLAPIAGIKLLHSQKPGGGARNLHRRSPPNHRVVNFIKRDSPRSNALPHAKRYQRTGIPECQGSHQRLSRSARNTFSTVLSETFPGGSGHDADPDRFFNGGARRPRATSLRSRSVRSSRWQGTIRATGWLRSQTSTSSPSRTIWMWALSRAFRSLIFTVLMTPL